MGGANGKDLGKPVAPHMPLRTVTARQEEWGLDCYPGVKCVPTHLSAFPLLSQSGPVLRGKSHPSGEHDVGNKSVSLKSPLR